MAKTEEELMEIKKKVEDLKTELGSLSDEELDRVAGGIKLSGQACSTEELRARFPNCINIVGQ